MITKKKTDNLSLDIKNTCDEINHQNKEEKKGGLISKITNLFHNNFIVNSIYHFEEEDTEFEKKVKIHLDKIGVIARDYNEIFEKHAFDMIHKKDVMFTFKEVLFCLKMMDASIVNIKINSSMMQNCKGFYIFDNLMEFIELFIVNFTKSQYDVSLKIKKMDLLNVILDISIFFKAQLKEKDIQLYVNGLVDNDTIIVGDYFYLFYSIMHIMSYILDNLYKEKKNGHFERKIVFNISNEEHKEKHNYKNVKIDIFVTNEHDMLSVNRKDIFDDAIVIKTGLSICKKIILAHNGAILYNFNQMTDTYHFIMIVPFLNNTDGQYVQNLSSKTIEKLLLLNHESRYSSKKFTIHNNKQMEEMNKLEMKSAPGSRTNSRNNSFVFSKNKETDDLLPFQLNKKILEYTKNINSKSFLEIDTLKILIVDDSRLNQKFLVHLLSMFFKEENFFIVENGMEALNEVNDNMYGIIFMDNNMPFLKGSFVIKLLRNMPFKGMIVGLTGDNIDVNDNEMLTNGANIVYKKPIKMEEIRNIHDYYSRNLELDDYTGFRLRKNEDGKLTMI